MLYNTFKNILGLLDRDRGERMLKKLWAGFKPMLQEYMICTPISTLLCSGGS
jgi:hypothetical protein